jgi:hypothetical protein
MILSIGSAPSFPLSSISELLAEHTGSQCLKSPWFERPWVWAHAGETPAEETPETVRALSQAAVL